MNAESHGLIVQLLAFSSLLTLLLTTSNVIDVASHSDDPSPPPSDANEQPSGAHVAPVTAASGSDLMLTWNGWGEGTAIGPAAGWIAAYVDIVDRPADAPAPSAPRREAPSPSSDAVVFGLSGDIGGKQDHAGVVLAAAGDDGAQWFGALGDLSYSEITPESAWCHWIQSTFPGPFEIVAGNHEDDEGFDGDITRFANCLRDRMNSTLGPGGYAANYFFDDGPVRMIMLSAGLSIDGTSPDLSVGR